MANDPLLALLKRPVLWLPPLIIIGLVVCIVFYFTALVAYLCLGLILSLLARPVYDWLEKVNVKQIRLSNSARAMLAVSSILILLGMVLTLVLPAVIIQFQNFSEVDPQALAQTLHEPLAKVEAWLLEKGFIAPSPAHQSPIEAWIYQTFQQWFQSDVWNQWVSPVISAFSTTLLGLFAIPFSAFFLLRDRRTFIRFFLTLLPPGLKPSVLQIVIQTRQMLSRYFLGLLIEMLLVACLVCIGLWIIGLPLGLALTLGCISGMFNLIPYLGPILGSALGLVLALAAHVHLPFENDILSIILKMSIVYLIVQSIDNFFLQPWIYSGSISAHPLEIFFVILAGGSLVGIPGMMLAVPVYTVIRLAAIQLFKTLQLLYHSEHEHKT